MFRFFKVFPSVVAKNRVFLILTILIQLLIKHSEHLKKVNIVYDKMMTKRFIISYWHFLLKYFRINVSIDLLSFQSSLITEQCKCLLVCPA